MYFYYLKFMCLFCIVKFFKSVCHNSFIEWPCNFSNKGETIIKYFEGFFWSFEVFCHTRVIHHLIDVYHKCNILVAHFVW